MSTSYDCARQMLDQVPMVMRVIRAEMRRQCANQLSVPQFRTIAYLYRNPGASLSQVAEHIGVTLPTMSRIVDRLVDRRLVLREYDPDSRRRLTLHITPKGLDLFETVRERTLQQIAWRLGSLSPERISLIQAALASLIEILQPDAP